MRSALQTVNLSHWFGPKKVLYSINIEIMRGEIVSLVGASGSGKSTLLKAILGTHPSCTGSVIIYPLRNGMMGRVVTDPGRDIGIVYQNYRLYDSLTALENVAIGPMFDETCISYRQFRRFAWKKLRNEHWEKAARLLTNIGLESAMSLKPKELSGGMQQRVAFAQAVNMEPEILLLDEPFASQDEKTRKDLQCLLLGIYAENCKALQEGRVPTTTIILVTHEIYEAIYVADRVLGLSQYWNWKEQGHEEFPGATIVYDCTAPVFFPGDTKDHNQLNAQREEILNVVCNPEYIKSPHLYRRLDAELEADKGQGVLNYYGRDELRLQTRSGENS